MTLSEAASKTDISVGEIKGGKSVFAKGKPLPPSFVVPPFILSLVTLSSGGFLTGILLFCFMVFVSQGFVHGCS